MVGVLIDDVRWCCIVGGVVDCGGLWCSVLMAWCCSDGLVLCWCFRVRRLCWWVVRVGCVVYYWWFGIYWLLGGWCGVTFVIGVVVMGIGCVVRVWMLVLVVVCVNYGGVLFYLQRCCCLGVGVIA